MPFLTGQIHAIVEHPLPRGAPLRLGKPALSSRRRDDRRAVEATLRFRVSASLVERQHTAAATKLRLRKFHLDEPGQALALAGRDLRERIDLRRLAAFTGPSGGVYSSCQRTAAPAGTRSSPINRRVTATAKCSSSSTGPNTLTAKH